MKYASLAAAAVAALAAWPALAQDTGPAGTIAAQSTDQYLAKDHLLGAKVHGRDGKIVGDVEDLIVNDQNQIIGVVLGTGGYFGFAERKVGFDLSALRFEDKDGVMSVSLPDATPDSLAAAPEFQRAKPAKSLLESAREKVMELTDKTSASTKDAYEKAKPAIEDAKQKAQEAYEKAKEAAAPTIEKAKEAVGEALDSAKQAADDAAAKAKDAADEAAKAVTPDPTPAPEAAPDEPEGEPEPAPDTGTPDAAPSPDEIPSND